MRLFRIWPALIVCVLITVFLLGPAVSALSFRAYFANRETWSYLVRDILLNNIRYTLPGVFQGNHFPGAVNGSLWTLPLEVKCYAMIFLLGCARVFRSGLAVLLVYALLFILFFSGNAYFSALGGGVQMMFLWRGVWLIILESRSILTGG
jgi:peptidoglycan/LPS O-acetylase OafA/YrhL